VAIVRNPGASQRRPPEPSGSRQSSRVRRTDAMVIDPVFELVAIEADVTTDLDDGDAPLVCESAHVALTRAQAECNLVEGEESS